VTNSDTGYLTFIRQNAPFLATGALLSFLSSFGQTYFISIFGGEIRTAYGLSNGDWGIIYMIGTGASAAVMVFAGGLADKFRVRQLGITVVLLLGLSCLLMALTPVAALLPLLVFLLRFFGQGMTVHVSSVAMSRWFIATRGRALAVAAMGFMLAEATLPLIMVWLAEIPRGLAYHMDRLRGFLFCDSTSFVQIAAPRTNPSVRHRN